VGVVAVHPAAHRARVAPEQLGDGRGGPALLESRIITSRSPIRCGPCSSLSRSQGSPAGQDRLAYTLGGRRLARAS
jgi:hypothetical protein